MMKLHQLMEMGEVVTSTEPDATNCLCGECKSLERSYMQLMDDYSGIARALGFDGSGFWGDVSEPHPAILARARACRAAYDSVHGTVK